ncbi:MAG TPA: ATP-binding protein [Thermoanaerobaculia bacterium]|nr:ATP-binding protein [Thermoanaerobaculia bacterium]
MKDDRRRPPAPLLFAGAAVVLFALVALATMPIFMNQRTDGLRNDVERHSEPARNDLNDVNYQLSIQMASLARAAATGNDAYLTSYRDAGVQRDEAMRKLVSDVRDLGPAVVGRADDLQAKILAWDRDVEAARFEANYPAVIEALRDMDEALGAFQRSAAREVRRLMLLQVVFSTILVVLAGIAAAVVIWMVLKLRNLAAGLARESDERMAALRTRDEILGVVSHDLRSPLTTIMLSTQMLESSPPDERTEFIETILATTRRMQRLIEDLLDATRIEAHNFSIRRETLDPAAVAREAFLSHVPIAAQKKITVEENIATPLPPISGDAGRLLQALSNLLGNAIKFTPEGGTVRLAAEARGGKLRFEVADSGPGIAPNDVPHLFDPFWQAKKTAHLGAGLGLKIARGIVEAHGGTIAVQNGSRGGACFVIEIPSSP